MPAVLPPALEALLRMEGRQYPNAAEMEMIGMPMGVPFSNQNPGTGYRNVPDGRLSTLTTMLSGLGAPMGYQPQQEPDPRTMFIRPVMSPTMAAGGEPAYRHIGGMAQPGQEQAMLQDILARGGANMGQATVQGYQARAAKSGEGMGIGDPQRYAEWKQGMADDEAGRRSLVNQRAMQVAQARTNRQSGMDPRTAALLAALGGENSELGGVVLGNALSPGFGAKAYELGVEERVHDKSNQAAIEKARIDSGLAPGGTAAKPDLRTSAAKIYAEKLQASRGDKSKAANDALIEVMKTGVSEAEAKAVIAELSGIDATKVAPAGTPQKKKPLLGAYGGFQREPEWGDVFGAATEILGDKIRNSKFWRTGIP